MRNRKFHLVHLSCSLKNLLEIYKLCKASRSQRPSPVPSRRLSGVNIAVNLDRQQHEELLILSPDERRLDAQAALPFKEAFQAAVESHPGPIGLDLSRVGFMDSSGLGAVVACFKQLGPGRPLVVINPTEAVRKLLSLTRIDRVLPVVVSQDEALQRTRA